MTLHLTHLGADASIERALGAPTVAPSPSRGLYRNVVKRALDMIVVILSAVIVVPLVALMALAVASDGHNPFYSQIRVGKNGRHFRLWKIRTMVPDADARLESHLVANPAARTEWDVTQKLKDDPRITLVGRVMRKTSMDELPQLWNVLTGSMSLVGPRPMMLSQVQYYYGAAYFRLKPGITGFWQISDRNECSFAERSHYDELYDQNLSLGTDMATLLRTVKVVVRGTGY